MDELHAAVASVLQGSGQRYTNSRRAVVAVLSGAGRPLTLPEILDADTELAQSSAYRNLAELVDAGVVRRIVTSDEYSHFEIAERLTGDHHHHLICSECGAVEDFSVTNELESLIDNASATVARTLKWQVEHHQLDLIGRCASCS